MSTSITIRDIPDDIYEKLKQQAELHHRSINSEVIVNLKKMVQSHRKDPTLTIALAKKLKNKATGSLSINQIQEAIDSERP